MTVDACALVSSGKDSNYALTWAVAHGFNVKCIITFHPLRKDSWMLQTINTELAVLQAEALGLPVFSYRVSGEKEKEVEEMKSVLADIMLSEGFDYLIAGALRSDYQRLRLEAIGDELGFRVISPAWWCDQAEYMRTLVRSGIEFVLTRVAAYGLGSRFLGRIVDSGMVEEIIELASRYGFNPAFEGGEAETLTVYTPLYKMRLCFEARIDSSGDVAELRFNRVWLDDATTDPRRCYVVRM